ncbi:helix-turn-helix transcriptional regulator [Sorangium sp. So ce134]
MATKRRHVPAHEKLAALVKKRGLTHEQASVQLGVSRVTVLSWANGHSRPDYGRRLAIALWSVEPDSDGAPTIEVDEWMNEEELRLTLSLEQARQQAAS